MKAATLLHVLGLVSSSALASVLGLEAGDAKASAVDPFRHLRPVCVVSDATGSISTTQTVETSTLSTSPTSSSSESTAAEATGLPVDPDNPEFVSFEEWKERRLAEERSTHAETPSQGSGQEAAMREEGKKTLQVDEAGEPSGAGGDTANASNASGQDSSSVLPPVVKRSVQLSHRYNYASPDCSARIHSAAPKTQNPSSLLHKSKDRYMLTPCAAAEHWVVVELCDEIRIEAIELGMFEFFSGVVREVVVSVGGEDGDDWEVVGEFKARNVRGVQAFTLASPTSFHRFLKVEFPSHYGSEYFCPVSSLKAYGMNQMEAFKAEQKRVNIEREQQGEEDRHREEARAKERRRAEEERRLWEKEEERRREIELERLEKLVELAGLGLESSPPESISPELATVSATITAARADQVKTATRTVTTETSSSASSKEKVRTQPSVAESSAPNEATSAETATAVTNTSVQSTAVDSSSVAANVTTSKIASQSGTSVGHQQTPPHISRPPARADSSESIYAFIIRRLTALEGNSTLTTRYIEEQMRSTRHLLLRIEKSWAEWKNQKEVDEVDRREVEMMRTEQRLGKLASQMEQQRVTAEQERRSIEEQLRTLTDELAFERRRGIAQLIILLVLLALGVLTRGAKMEAVLMPLLAEARRRSVSHRRSRLSGLSFDLGRGGLHKTQEATAEPTATNSDVLGFPRSPSVRSRGTPRGVASRRPMTPTTAKRRSTPGRSFSLHEEDPVAAASTPTPNKLHHPRPRVSLPPGGRPLNSGPPRKLARSSHLHTLEADHIRSDLRHAGSPASRTVSNSSEPIDIRQVSPLSGSSVVFPDMTEPASEAESTDNEGTEASASEVEDEVIAGGGVFDDLKKELKDVWNGV